MTIKEKGYEKKKKGKSFWNLFRKNMLPKVWHLYNELVVEGSVPENFV